MAEVLYANILFQKYYTFCHGISSYPYNSTSAIIVQKYHIPTIVPIIIIVTSHEMADFSHIHYKSTLPYPIGSMYAIYGIIWYSNIYHQYTPNVSIYTIHGSYGY